MEEPNAKEIFFLNEIATLKALNSALFEFVMEFVLQNVDIPENELKNIINKKISEFLDIYIDKELKLWRDPSVLPNFFWN